MMEFGILLGGMKDTRKSFFNKMDWLAFWCSLGVSLLVYLCSLGPSVGLEDAGELATAAQVLGVPHPPGYPLWTILGWGFCRLLGWVTWQGYPNPAWAVALFSALSGALATGLTALLTVRSGRTLLQKTHDVALQCVGTDWRTWCAWWGGVAGSLCFAFSPVMWSQAVIVEVYALGALFMALVMLLTYRWLERPSGRTLLWLGFVFGLGLTNYQVLLLAALPIGLLIFLRNRTLAFSFLSIGIPLGLTAYVLTLGALPSADLYSTPGAPVILRPDPTAFPSTYFYGALAFALLGVIATLRLHLKKPWIILACGIVVGLLSLSGCHWMETDLPSGFRGTCYAFWRAWLIHLIALGGLWAMCWRFKRSRSFAIAITIVQLTLLILLQQGLLLGLEHPTTGWFWWGIAWNLLLLYLASQYLVAGRTVALTLLAAELGVSVYAYMPLVSDLLNPAMNWGYPRTWEGFKHAISRGQYEAIAPSTFFSKRYLMQLWDYITDLRLQFSLPIVGVAIMGTLMSVVHTLQKHLKRERLWLLCTLLFFGVMSALLIALANPTGDLQDGFIQKVKFISSHGVFALWVGYGFMMISVWLVRRWQKAGLLTSLFLACAIIITPLIENAVNDTLIHRMGASEQTGHDFGWQFGAYMLGGAPTLNTELSPEEEPLPDPFYPPPMATDAVLFGGTDPGRFVPTYMVYAAGFRSDVHVLTQNALADPTYMSVERDLYGDHLWLPTADEVRNAFIDYVDEVQAGKRTTRGQIIEENGKMRIVGAAAVMDINEVLAERIFKRNPNTFYVEESYAMPWMNTLLEPAGLAMKLQRTETDLDDTLRQRDADFWDWMTRRLTDRTAYRRDFAAKKSFSKLRSSIAELYMKRQYPQDAERAFYDALRLYPASSESVFRTIQTYHLPYGHFGAALRLLKHYQAGDPNNQKTAHLVARLQVLSEAYHDYETLSAKIKTGEGTTSDLCALATVCEELSMKSTAIAHWKTALLRTDLTANDACSGTIALQRLRDFETAIHFLKRVPESFWTTFSEPEYVASAGLAQRYGELDLALRLFRSALAKYPQSGRVWLGISLYYYELGNEPKAYECMSTAVRNGAAALIEEDPAVAEIFLRLMRRYGPQKGR